eukprot:scaffold51588_cov42-Cyclotella_meneghiniana.AAC.1
MTRRARNRVNNGPLCLLFMCDFTTARTAKAACKAETGAVFNGPMIQWHVSSLHRRLTISSAASSAIAKDTS